MELNRNFLANSLFAVYCSETSQLNNMILNRQKILLSTDQSPTGILDYVTEETKDALFYQDLSQDHSHPPITGEVDYRTFFSGIYA